MHDEIASTPRPSKADCWQENIPTLTISLLCSVPPLASSMQRPPPSQSKSLTTFCSMLAEVLMATTAVNMVRRQSGTSRTIRFCRQRRCESRLMHRHRCSHRDSGVYIHLRRTSWCATIPGVWRPAAQASATNGCAVVVAARATSALSTSP